MGNLRTDLEEFERIVGEPILAIAIGRRRVRDDFDHDAAISPIGRAEGLAVLDYVFDGCVGGCERPHPFFAWTRSWTVFPTGEDGLTTLAWVPRSPRRCVPEHGGGWWLCGPHDWRSLAD